MLAEAKMDWTDAKIDINVALISRLIEDWTILTEELPKIANLRGGNKRRREVMKMTVNKRIYEIQNQIHSLVEENDRLRDEEDA